MLNDLQNPEIDEDARLVGMILNAYERFFRKINFDSMRVDEAPVRIRNRFSADRWGNRSDYREGTGPRPSTG
jgi:hypothetical protein